HLADSFTAIFDDVSLAAASANLSDDSQNQILGRNAFFQLTLNLNSHGLERLQRQSLGRHDVLYFRSTNAHGDRTKSTVGRSMRVTADDGHAGLGNAQLRTNGVDDALLFITHRVQAHSEFLTVIAQRRYLGTGSLIDDFQQVAGLNSQGGHVVVLGRKMQLGVAHLSSGQAQAIKSLWAGNLMQQLGIDVNQIRRTIFTLGNYVVAPHLFCQRQFLGHFITPLEISLIGTYVSIYGRL